MKVDKFRAKAVCTITSTLVLGIDVQHEDGEDYVYSVYLNEEGTALSKVAKSNVRYDFSGNPYFIRSREKYYISEFIRCDYP